MPVFLACALRTPLLMSARQSTLGTTKTGTSLQASCSKAARSNSKKLRRSLKRYVMGRSFLSIFSRTPTLKRWGIHQTQLYKCCSMRKLRIQSHSIDKLSMAVLFHSVSDKWEILYFDVVNPRKSNLLARKSFFERRAQSVAKMSISITGARGFSFIKSSVLEGRSKQESYKISVSSRNSKSQLQMYKSSKSSSSASSRRSLQ